MAKHKEGKRGRGAGRRSRPGREALFKYWMARRDLRKLKRHLKNNPGDKQAAEMLPILETKPVTLKKLGGAIGKLPGGKK